MKTPVRRLGPLVVLLPAALAAVSVAAIEPETLPQPLTGVAQTVAEAAESAGREAGRAGGAAEGYPGVIENAGADASPARSRLLRSLNDRTAQVSASQPSTAAGTAPPGASDLAVVGAPGSTALFGCPRALLSALLAGAAETGDVVSALAIERETLALCRERQEIVTGIVMLEGELRALLAESRGETAAPAHSAVTPIVKESTPVRVVRHLSPSPDRAEPAEAAKADTPKPPAWSWFSIIGTAGDLRAGVSDGSRVWFVREGDRLPGAVTVERIAVRPPGVHVGGADEAALPYRPRPEGAIPAGGIAGGEGS